MDLGRVRLRWVALVELVDWSDLHPLYLGMTGTPPLLPWHRPDPHGWRVALRVGMLDDPLSNRCARRVALLWVCCRMRRLS